MKRMMETGKLPGIVRHVVAALHRQVILLWHSAAFMFRIYYSDDGYVWTAYNSRLSSTDLGQVFEREAATTTVYFDPPIRV